MTKLEDILGIPCTQYYTDEYLERAVATARAEALREAADRAAKEIEDQGMEEVVSVKRLQAAIYAGEVKE